MAMSISSELEFKLCRLCLCAGHRLMDIFSGSCPKDFSVEETIQDLLTFKVDQNPDFPWLVCSTCMTKLTDFRLFKRRCLECKVAFESRFLGTELRINEEEVGNAKGTDKNSMRDASVQTEEGDGTSRKSPVFDVTPPCEVPMMVEATSVHYEPSTNEIADVTVGKPRPKVPWMETVELLPTPPCAMDSCSMKNMGAETNQLYDRTEYTCNDCGFKCSDVIELRVHTCGRNVNRKLIGKTPKKKNSHVGSSLESTKVNCVFKPFKCDKCAKEFTLKGTLVRHLTLHTGLKPFQCKTCGKNFSLKGNLVQHIAIHTGCKPFKCEVCGKNFAKKNNLVSHSAVHSELKPFKCDTCGKNFVRRNNLLEHLFTHTGLKPFNCETCGKNFVRKAELVRHLAVHAERKVFKCEECGKQFIQKRYFMRHLVLHSERKPSK